MSYRLVIDIQQKDNNQIHLSAEQEHYLKRVVRLQPGDTFIALDGQGECWLAQLDSNQKTATIIKSISQAKEISLNIDLMVGLPKGGGFEEIVRSCTELGVSRFIPLKSERSLLVPSSNKLERWRKVAQEAAEQSERQIVPKILPPLDLTTAISQLNLAEMTAYLCVTRVPEAEHLVTSLQLSPPTKPLIIAIGPEGGWSDQEVKQFLCAGFKLVTLGKRILRTITAPLVAVSMVLGILKE